MPASASPRESSGWPSPEPLYSFARLHWKSDATGPGRTLSISPDNPYTAKGTIDLDSPAEVAAFLARAREEALLLWPHAKEIIDGD